MSIVSDALKKAQEQNGKFKKDTFAPDIVIKDKAPKGNHGSGIKNIFLAAVAICVLGFAAFWIKETYFNDKGIYPISSAEGIKRGGGPKTKNGRLADKGEAVLTKEPEIENKPKLKPGPLEAYIEPPPIAEPLPRRLFTLNGIVFGDGSPYAIINDNILEEGDYVNGAAVMRIEENEVTLDDQGRKITLILK